MEFCEVMRQAKRMCAALDSCNQCPLRTVIGMSKCPVPSNWTNDPAVFEKVITEWADGPCSARIMGLEYKLMLAKAERDQAERERDAALADLREADEIDCVHCKHYKWVDDNAECHDADINCSTCKHECPCKDCLDLNHWEWRGVQEVEGNA